MDNKILIEQILSDNETDKMLIESLKAELDDEMKKPFAKRDFDKIESLSCQISELVMGEEMLSAKTDAGITLLKEKASQPAKQKKYFRFRPVFVALCSFAAVFMVLNTVTLFTSGMNLFSAIVKYSKEAVSFDFSYNNSEEDSLPETQPHTYDSRGILKACEDFGYSPDVPHYLPTDFELTEFTFNRLNDSDDLFFEFSDGNSGTLYITYQCYRSRDKIPPQIVPSDDRNYEYIKINGTEAFILEDESDYTIICEKNNIVTILNSDSLDYEEFMSVANSIK